MSERARHFDDAESMLTIEVEPLPASGGTLGRHTDCWVASEPDELRALLRDLLANGVERFQVRMDLTKLTDGFVMICGKGDSGDAFEARQSARYLKRAARRLEAWAARIDQDPPPAGGGR